MRPLPDEILDNVRTFIDGTVAPCISDSYITGQLALVSSLLEHVSLRIVLEDQYLVDDLEDLLKTLEQLSLNAELSSEVRTFRSMGVLSTLNDRRDAHDRLLNLVERVVRSLEARSRAGDQSAASGAKVMGEALRRHLDRERTMLGPGFSVGT